MLPLVTEPELAGERDIGPASRAPLPDRNRLNKPISHLGSCVPAPRIVRPCHMRADLVYTQLQQISAHTIKQTEK
jgi:hypothetical protein